jgi:acyl-CoA thioester hydrolase
LNKPRFSIPVRIYYEDTDAGGVVYHANYLRFMERARTEWLREIGYDLDVMTREVNLVFVVRAVTINYHKPARLNDQLNVSAELTRMGRASLDIVHQVTRENELLCDATVTLVTVKAATMKEELSSWMSQ